MTAYLDNAATTRVLAGDVYSDGDVSVTDVMLMVKYIQGKNRIIIINGRNNK